LERNIERAKCNSKKEDVKTLRLKFSAPSAVDFDQGAFLGLDGTKTEDVDDVSQRNISLEHRNPAECPVCRSQIELLLRLTLGRVLLYLSVRVTGRGQASGLNGSRRYCTIIIHNTVSSVICVSNSVACKPILEAASVV
jgi:hypothetical protein